MENKVNSYMQVTGTKPAITEFVKRLHYYDLTRTERGFPAPSDGNSFYRASLNMAWFEVIEVIERAFAHTTEGEESTAEFDPNFAWSALSSMFVDECYDDTHNLKYVISLQAACATDGVDVAFDAEGDGYIEMGEADRYGNFRIATKALTTYHCRDCGYDGEVSPTQEYDIGIVCDSCGGVNVEYEKSDVTVLFSKGVPNISPVLSEGKAA